MVTEKKYIRGHFIGIGLAAGIPLGVPIGFFIGQIGLGLIIGLGIGALGGFITEKQLNKNPIPLSDFEKRRQRLRLRAGIIGGVLLLTALLLFYFIGQ